MTREDLFAAIGMVESSRLMRSEMAIAEQPRILTKRLVRNILVAVIILSMLLLTACAFVGYVIFENPAEMIEAIFGDRTGYDHGDFYTYPDPEYGDVIYEVPGFDRVPVDETLASREIVPHISAVGQSITWRGYTLTVDALMYDSITQCGILTYQVENPEGVTYNVESTGEVWGQPVNFNQGGESYIIREKTTDTCLTVAQYFWYDPADTRDMEITMSQWTFVQPGPEYQAHIMELFEQIKQEYTVEQAIEAYIEAHGQEEYDRVKAESTEEEMENFVYGELWTRRLEELYACPEKIVLHPDQESALTHITLAKGAVTISPISMLVDVTNLEFLHTDLHGNTSVDAGNVRSLVIRYADGSEYTVFSDTVNNTVDATSSQGEGGAYTLGRHIFNRIIDVDRVDAVIANGVELTLDK